MVLIYTVLVVVLDYDMEMVLFMVSYLRFQITYGVGWMILKGIQLTINEKLWMLQLVILKGQILVGWKRLFMFTNIRLRNITIEKLRVGDTNNANFRVSM